jgi:hypothetical protein
MNIKRNGMTNTLLVFGEMSSGGGSSGIFTQAMGVCQGGPANIGHLHGPGLQSKAINSFSSSGSVARKRATLRSSGLGQSLLAGTPWVPSNQA